MLGHFNATPRLHEIHVPVLLTSGRFDTMRPSVVALMKHELPCAEWHTLPHSGHISMIDDAQLMLTLLNDFLSRVESGGLCDMRLSLWEQPWLGLALMPLIAIASAMWSLFKPRSRDVYFRML